MYRRPDVPYKYRKVIGYSNICAHKFRNCDDASINFSSHETHINSTGSGASGLGARCIGSVPVCTVAVRHFCFFISEFMRRVPVFFFYVGKFCVTCENCGATVENEIPPEDRRKTGRSLPRAYQFLARNSLRIGKLEKIEK